MNYMTRMCSLCHKPKPAKGGTLRNVLGLRAWVCAACKPQTNTATKK
jgi:hypothetical protein